MTPEAKALEHIGRKLVQTGWVVQDLKLVDLGAARGGAMRAMGSKPCKAHNASGVA